MTKHTLFFIQDNIARLMIEFSLTTQNVRYVTAEIIKGVYLSSR